MYNYYGDYMDHKLKTFIKFIVVFILIVIALILYSRFIGTKGIVVKEYSIVNKDIPKSFYGFKIVHISDIHYKMTTDKDDLKKIKNEINLIEPDIVIFTGDLLDKNINYRESDYSDLIKFLSDIDYNIGKYYITGDNDNDEKIKGIMDESDFISLNDTYKLIYNGDNEPILITGVSSNYKDNKIKEVIENLKVNEEYKYSILVLHEPDYINYIEYSNYNLILAGHSFNGLIKLPFIDGIIKDKGSKNYINDYYKLGNTKLYVSGGLGTSKIKFRFLNKPSFNLYRLRNV